MSEEYEELTEEIYLVSNDDGTLNFWHKEDKDYSKIRNEAAEIMNFAAMIILKCYQELKDN